LRECGTAKQNHSGDGKGERPIQMVSHMSPSRAAEQQFGIEVCGSQKVGIRENDEMAHQWKNNRFRCRRKHRLSSLPSKIDDWLFLFSIRSGFLAKRQYSKVV
jgi:hypothetical protein